mgnify:CR=1 FL=1
MERLFGSLGINDCGLYAWKMEWMVMVKMVVMLILLLCMVLFFFFFCFFFQAEDGIRDLVRSRGLGDVYKRQVVMW